MGSYEESMKRLRSSRGKYNTQQRRDRMRSMHDALLQRRLMMAEQLKAKREQEAAAAKEKGFVNRLKKSGRTLLPMAAAGIGAGLNPVFGGVAGHAAGSMLSDMAFGEGPTDPTLDRVAAMAPSMMAMGAMRGGAGGGGAVGGYGGGGGFGNRYGGGADVPTFSFTSGQDEAWTDAGFGSSWADEMNKQFGGNVD